MLLKWGKDVEEAMESIGFMMLSIKSTIHTVWNNWEVYWPTQEEVRSARQQLTETMRVLVPFGPSTHDTQQPSEGWNPQDRGRLPRNRGPVLTRQTLENGNQLVHPFRITAGEATAMLRKRQL